MSYNFEKARLEAVLPMEQKMMEFFRDYYEALVIPTCRLNANMDIAPMALNFGKDLIMPEALVFSRKFNFWAELKCTGQSPYNRKLQDFVLGFKRSQYEDYMKIAAKSGMPVIVFWIVADSVIMGGNLQVLKAYDCQCKECSCGRFQNCRAEQLVYFKASELNSFKAMQKYILGGKNEK